MTTQATPGARPMAMTGTGLVTALMTPNAGLADLQGTGQYSSRKNTIFQTFLRLLFLKLKLSSCLILYTLFLTILWKNIHLAVRWSEGVRAFPCSTRLSFGCQRRRTFPLPLPSGRPRVYRERITFPEEGGLGLVPRPRLGHRRRLGRPRSFHSLLRSNPYLYI